MCLYLMDANTVYLEPLLSSYDCFIGSLGRYLTNLLVQCGICQS